MFRRHVSPGFAIHGSIRRLAHQEQAEGQRLREGRREKRVETLGVLAGRLRMGVKHLAKFVAHGLQRRSSPHWRSIRRADPLRCRAPAGPHGRDSRRVPPRRALRADRPARAASRLSSEHRRHRGSGARPLRPSFAGRARRPGRFRSSRSIRRAEKREDWRNSTPPRQARTGTARTVTYRERRDSGLDRPALSAT